MSAHPLNTPFTPRELAFGARVAVGLWLLTAGLLAALATWSVLPRWAA